MSRRHVALAAVSFSLALTATSTTRAQTPPDEEPAARLAGEGGMAPAALGDSNEKLVYTPVTPCRLIDTRLAGGSLAPGTVRDFKVAGAGLQIQGGNPAGCGVPFGPATAAAINFVAVNPVGAGNLRAWAYSTPPQPPPGASVLNYAAVSGLNIANGIVVPLCDPAFTTCPGLDLRVQADVSGTHLVADVVGFFQRFPTEEGAVPAGAILDFGGTAAPPGFLLCDGSAVSRTTFARLFAAIGTAYGAGDGTTTFNVPDLRGRFTRGRDAGAGRDPNAATRGASGSGGNTGDAVGSLQDDVVGPHNHRFKVHVEARGTGGGFSAVDGPDDANPSPVMSDGSGIGPESRPKNVYVNKIIKH